ncbi:MAG: NlpC/P60 family protein, partial [Cytophagaceae bacterium]
MAVHTHENGNSPSVYGICHLSIVPVRTLPSDDAEISTQLLFGDSFFILDVSENKKWIRIRVAFDGYEGWIDRKQYKSISDKFYELLNSVQWPVCKDLVGLLHGTNRVTPVIYGCSLPFFNKGVISIESEAFRFQGDVFYPVKNADFSFLKNIACFYLSAPYLWGGKTHFGIDCSGFVQQVFKICGIKLPRDAYQQAESGIGVSLSSHKPGDVAFFTNENGEVSHVGIILEHQ